MEYKILLSHLSTQLSTFTSYFKNCALWRIIEKGKLLNR